METPTKQQSEQANQAPTFNVPKAKLVRVTKKQEKENARNEAIATLRRMGVKPGADIYTIVTHVSSSGMSRHIRCYLPTTETYTERGTDKRKRKPSIMDITGLVSIACDIRRSSGNSWDLVVGGCGMDMCFHTVYRLAHAMFPGHDRAGYMLNKRDL